MLLLRAIAAALFTSALFGIPSFAQQNAGDAQHTTSDAALQQLQRALNSRDLVIVNLEQRVEALERQLKVTSASPAQTPAPAPNLPAATTSFVAPKPSQTEYDEEERVARATLDSMLVARSSLLLPRWTLEVQNSATYYNSSSNNISVSGYAILPILVVGQVESTRIKRQIILGNMTTRLGLPHDFQVEASLPYGYEIQNQITSSNVETESTSTGIGDFELALYKQLYHQKKRWPDVLAGFRWKFATGADPYAAGVNSPTLGTGFQAFQTSLTLAKTSDPGIFYGGLSYTHNLPGNKGIQNLDPNTSATTPVIYGRVDPGGTIGFSVGTAFALNSQASFLVGYQQYFTRPSLLNDVHIAGSALNTGLLQLGASYMYAKGRTMDLTIGIGLTRDTPDFQFTVAWPLRFPLKQNPRPSAAAYRQTEQKKGSDTEPKNVQAESTKSAN